MMLLFTARRAFKRIFTAFPAWVWGVFSGLGGFALALGLYTFSYAQGLSYLSNDPKACVNCHVMQDMYEGWIHGSHKSVATCNDCHIPHDLIGKYYAKSLNGWHHSSAFTTGDFHEPIRIKQFNKEILQENCLHCHQGLVVPILHSNQHPQNDCLRCHSDVGHGF